MSPNSLTLTIPVKNGRLNPSMMQRANLDGFVQKHDGKTLTIKLSRPQSTRSLQQNAFLWGFVYTPIALHTGHTTEEVHEVLKDLFLPRRFVRLGTREVEIRKSTADLPPVEFNQYVERIRAWASQEFGMNFPEQELTPTRTRSEPEKVKR